MSSTPDTWARIVGHQFLPQLLQRQRGESIAKHLIARTPHLRSSAIAFDKWFPRAPAVVRRALKETL